MSTFDDPEHWRGRAEEARSIAEQLTDPASKRTMLRIAAITYGWPNTLTCGREGNRDVEVKADGRAAIESPEALT